MTSEELQAMLQAAYSGQVNPANMGLDYGPPKSAWESYKYNVANPGRTDAEPDQRMALADYPKVWYDRVIGQPLQGMKGAGDALLGRTNPDVESFQKDVLDALSLYAGSTIAKGMLGGVPKATELSIFGGVGAKEAPLRMRDIAEKALAASEKFNKWREDLPVLDIENLKNDVPFMTGDAERGFVLKAKHGTRQDFDKFEKTKDLGFHVGNAEQASAERFSGGDSGRILQVHAKIKNPLAMQDLNTWQPEQILSELYRKADLGEISSKANVSQLEERMYEISRKNSYVYDPNVRKGQLSEIREFIKNEGYDAITYMNRGEGKDIKNSFIILNSENIKTGIGGTATPDEVWKYTGWKPGMEGKMRFEISDKDMALNPEFWGQGGAKYSSWMDPKKNEWADIRMGQVAKHDAAYANYPEMRDVKVRLGDPESMGSKRGFFDETTNTATIKANLTSDEARDVLLHEVGGHYVQGKENFARGGSPSDYFDNESIKLMGKANDYGRFAEDSVIQEIAKASKEGNVKKIWELKSKDEEAYNIATRLYKELGDYPTSDLLKKKEKELMVLSEKKSSFGQYQNTAGEIEANDIVNRRTWDTDMRRAVPPDMRKDAIVRMGSPEADAFVADVLKELHY